MDVFIVARDIQNSSSVSLTGSRKLTNTTNLHIPSTNSLTLLPANVELYLDYNAFCIDDQHLILHPRKANDFIDYHYIYCINTSVDGQNQVMDFFCHSFNAAMDYACILLVTCGVNYQ